MTNTTAAQPLDLDKLEALARAAYIADERTVALLQPATILDLIVHARAAQPGKDAVMDAMCNPKWGNPDLYARLVRFFREELPLAQQQDKVNEWVNAVLSAAPFEAEKYGYIGRAAKPESATGTTGATEPSLLAIELQGVREEMAAGSGFWSSCSGCYDTDDGHPTGNYSYSTVFGCALGSGCSECGGIGAVWDNTDYEAMARDWDKDAAPASAQPVLPEKLPEKLPDDVLRYVMECAGRNNPDGAREVKAIYTFLRDALLHPVAPASAQPADMSAEMRALCPNCGGTGEVHRADGEYMGDCDCPASAQPADPDLFADEAKRLRRVVRALGMDKEVPEDDASLRECLFSVLGLIARKLEASAQPNRGAALVADAPQYENVMDHNGRIIGVRMTNADKMPSYAAPSPASQPVAPEAGILENRIEALRTALRQISETRFGWDGDCGVTSISDDALYADEQAAAMAAAPSSAAGKEGGNHG